LQKREKLYRLKTLDKSRLDFPYKKPLQFNQADQIVCFYPQAKYVLTDEELITKPTVTSRDYVDMCKRGAAEVSIDFYEDFLKTTTTPV